MIISNFVEPELSYFRRKCNFTQDELNVFELRSEGKTLNETADKLNLSLDIVKKISQKVNKKIIKVL